MCKTGCNLHKKQQPLLSCFYKQRCYNDMLLDLMRTHVKSGELLAKTVHKGCRCNLIFYLDAHFHVSKFAPNKQTVGDYRKKGVPL